jgi:coenzyme F420-0:L-glutamate ligase/coenzyme F420-1:gamma-L-glutamate ligase
VRVVATRERADGSGTTRIVENRQGLVMAAAGVDASNAPAGHVLLLPEDPDASARTIAELLRDRLGIRIGVILTDTFGRPWRDGQTDQAIGAAGVKVIDDLAGTTDANGKLLEVTAPAIADELAAASELVKGKAGGRPVAVIRGLGHLVTDLDAPGARALIRPSERDMFRQGSREAYAEGYAAGLAARQS